MASRQNALASYLSLFSSVGTLLCCTLPSLLVLLGLGATMAAVVSAAPWLVTLSRHKGWVFAVSGLLVASNFLYVYRLAPGPRAQGSACEAGDDGACDEASAVSRVVLWLSAAVYLAGFSMAYGLGPLLLRLSE